MSTPQSYLESNLQYWNKGYKADNVESFVFRPYGRIFRDQFGMDGSKHEKLLDYGCGAGACLNFFASKGFNVFGVDISDTDLNVCRELMPAISDNFLKINPMPTKTDKFFGGEFDIVVAIQSLYYLTDTALDIRIKNLYDQMKKGGLFYATMIGTNSWYYNHSTDCGDGLRKVTINSPRLKIDDYFINFTKSNEDLLKRFSMFKKQHIGFYDAAYRDDEGRDFHFTFVGTKE